MKKTLFAAIFCIALFGCTDNKHTLHVYSWSDYFDPELIMKFEAEYNCHIVIDTFDSNEAMFAKLKAGATGYDIMVPSSYQVEALAKEGMIAEIDHLQLINVSKNFNHDLDNQVLDKNMRWSVPYVCTYTGFMCDSKLADEAKSWKILENAKYKGKISLLDDIREVIGAGLMYCGYSLNSTNEQEIAAAVKQVLKWKLNIRKFDAESYKLEVANKSSLIGHGYSSDAIQVILEDNRNDIAFVLPDEGFTIAWDEFVISSSSKEKQLAYKFIDFFYDTDTACQNMAYVCGLMANKYALQLVPDKYKKLFMPNNLSKGQVLKGFSDQKTLDTYNKAWDTIKSIKR